MKNDVVQFVFALLVLILGGAAEELLPKFLGVGFPFLLMSVIFLAPRRTVLSSVLFAVAAGTFADALSCLPFATSVCFFVVAALLSRRIEISYLAMGVAFPLFQIWTWIWRPDGDAGIFGRFLVSILLGPLTGIFAILFLSWLERKAALNGR